MEFGNNFRVEKFARSHGKPYERKKPIRERERVKGKDFLHCLKWNNSSVKIKNLLTQYLLAISVKSLMQSKTSFGEQSLPSTI